MGAPAAEGRHSPVAGDYRIVYEIWDSELLVLVLRMAHRREVYRGR